jgi:hypothetical protein
VRRALRTAGRLAVCGVVLATVTAIVPGWRAPLQLAQVCWVLAGVVILCAAVERAGRR